jgi:hypothetical protein
MYSDFKQKLTNFKCLLIIIHLQFHDFVKLETAIIVYLIDLIPNLYVIYQVIKIESY